MAQLLIKVRAQALYFSYRHKDTWFQQNGSSCCKFSTWPGNLHLGEQQCEWSKVADDPKSPKSRFPHGLQENKHWFPLVSRPSHPPLCYSRQLKEKLCKILRHVTAKIFQWQYEEQCENHIMYNSSCARKNSHIMAPGRQTHRRGCILTSRFTCLPRCCFNTYSFKVRSPGIFLNGCWGKKLVYKTTMKCPSRMVLMIKWKIIVVIIIWLLIITTTT